MRDIFSELYNKVLGFFKSNEPKEENAKDVACNRLKFVLMQDRTNLNPQLLEKLRGELVDLLSKYVEMDKEALELNFEQEGEQMALMLSIPVIRAKDEEEINAIIEAEAEIEEECECQCECDACDCEDEECSCECQCEEQEEEDENCEACEDDEECSCLDTDEAEVEAEESEETETIESDEEPKKKKKKHKNK